MAPSVIGALRTRIGQVKAQLNGLVAATPPMDEAFEEGWDSDKKMDYLARQEVDLKRQEDRIKGVIDTLTKLHVEWQQRLNDIPANPAKTAEWVAYEDAIAEDDSFLISIDKAHLTLIQISGDETNARRLRRRLYEGTYRSAPGPRGHVDDVADGQISDLHVSVTTRQVKLPECKMEPFDGDPFTWPIFAGTYCHAIHDNPDLSDHDRMTYLLSSCLTGDALRTVAGFRNRPEDYAEAWKLLEETYGDEGLVELTINEEVDEILENAAAPVRLKAHVSDSSTDTKPDPTAVPEEASFPDDDDDSVELSHVAKKYPGDQKCLFCGGNHQSTDCRKYASAHRRRLRLTELKRCTRCLRLTSNHDVKVCICKRVCIDCEGSRFKRHYRFLCPKNFPEIEPSEGPRGQSAKASAAVSAQDPDKPEGDGAEEESTNCHFDASSLATRETIFLMTKVLPVSAEPTSAIRMTPSLFDGGSTNSYITRKHADRIGARPEREVQRSGGAFNSSKRVTRTVQLTAITLHFLDGATLTMEVGIADHITPSLRFLHVEALSVEGNSKWYTKSSQKTIHLLIGADYLYDVVNYSTIRRLTNGCLLINSRVGLVATGPVHAFPDSSDNASRFTLATKTTKSATWLEDESLVAYSAQQHLRWHSIPYHRSWIGGVYERVVGLIKAAFKTVVNGKGGGVIALRPTDPTIDNSPSTTSLEPRGGDDNAERERTSVDEMGLIWGHRGKTFQRSVNYICPLGIATSTQAASPVADHPPAPRGDDDNSHASRRQSPKRHKVATRSRAKALATAGFAIALLATILIRPPNAQRCDEIEGSGKVEHPQQRLAPHQYCMSRGIMTQQPSGMYCYIHASCPSGPIQQRIADRRNCYGPVCQCPKGASGFTHHQCPGALNSTLKDDKVKSFIGGLYPSSVCARHASKDYIGKGNATGTPAYRHRNTCQVGRTFCFCPENEPVHTLHDESHVAVKTWGEWKGVVHDLPPKHSRPDRCFNCSPQRSHLGAQIAGPSGIGPGEACTDNAELGSRATNLDGEKYTLHVPFHMSNQVEGGVMTYFASFLIHVAGLKPYCTPICYVAKVAAMPLRLISSCLLLLIEALLGRAKWLGRKCRGLGRRPLIGSSSVLIRRRMRRNIAHITLLCLISGLVSESTSRCADFPTLMGTHNNYARSEDGQVSDSFTQSALLNFMPRGQQSCLLLYDRKLLGSSEMVMNGPRLRCFKHLIAFTVDVDIFNTEINGLKGFTKHHRSGGRRNCFLPQEGCLFGCYAARPKSREVYEIFRCATWQRDEELKITPNNNTELHHMAIHRRTTKLQHRALLSRHEHPYHASSLGGDWDTPAAGHPMSEIDCGDRHVARNCTAKYPCSIHYLHVETELVTLDVEKAVLRPYQRRIKAPAAVELGRSEAVGEGALEWIGSHNLELLMGCSASEDRPAGRSSHQRHSHSSPLFPSTCLSPNRGLPIPINFPAPYLCTVACRVSYLNCNLDPNFRHSTTSTQPDRELDQSPQQPSNNKLQATWQTAAMNAKQTVKFRDLFFIILDVEPTATEAELKLAYRKRATLLHPDKCGEKEATEAFKAVGYAFEVLSDEKLRATYLRLLKVKDTTPSAIITHMNKAKAAAREEEAQRAAVRAAREQREAAAREQQIEEQERQAKERDEELVRGIYEKRYTLYSLLDVERNAESQAIREAADSLATRVDLGTNRSPNAELAFQVVLRAKKLLLGADSRAFYDLIATEGSAKDPNPVVAKSWMRAYMEVEGDEARRAALRGQLEIEMAEWRRQCTEAEEKRRREAEEKHQQAEEERRRQEETVGRRRRTDEAERHLSEQPVKRRRVEENARRNTVAPVGRLNERRRIDHHQTPRGVVGHFQAAGFRGWLQQQQHQEEQRRVRLERQEEQRRRRQKEVPVLIVRLAELNSGGISVRERDLEERAILMDFLRIMEGIDSRPSRSAADCVFCQVKGHWARYCQRWPRIGDRDNIARQGGLCRRCLVDHRGALCKKEGACHNCGDGGHHAALCPNTYAE